MKLGIICSFQNEKTFDVVKTLGVDGVEFTVNHNIDSKAFLEGAPAIRKALSDRGLATLSVGRWGMKRLDDDGHILPEALEHDKNVIASAEVLGCGVFNCGVNAAKNLNRKQNLEMAYEYFGKLLDFAADKGVKIAAFNCDWENFVVGPAEWDVLLPALPALGIKYDPSHAIGRAKGYGTYLSEMKRYGDRFHHFHVKGALYIDGERYDDPPAGMDGINWGAVFDLLYTKNYAGTVSYEPHSPYWTGSKGRWAIDFSLAYIKPFLMPEDYVGEMSSAYML